MQIEPITYLSGKIYRKEENKSSLSYLLVVCALNPLPKEVSIMNIKVISKDDNKLIFLLKKMGANIDVNLEDNSIIIKGGQILEGLQIDCSKYSEFLPILCVLGVYCNYRTRIYNLDLPEINEKNQITPILKFLRGMGAFISDTENELIFDGPQQLKGIEIEYYENYQIIEAFIITALYCRTPSILQNPNIILKSNPDFFEELKIIGVDFKET